MGLRVGGLLVPAGDDARELRVEVAVAHGRAARVRRSGRPKPAAAPGRTVTMGSSGEATESPDPRMRRCACASVVEFEPSQRKADTVVLLVPQDDRPRADPQARSSARGWRARRTSPRRGPRSSRATTCPSPTRSSCRWWSPRRVTFLAKSDYFTGRGIKGRLTAAFFRGVGQLPVDRSGGKASKAALSSGLQGAPPRRAARHLPRGHPLARRPALPRPHRRRPDGPRGQGARSSRSR